MRPERVKLFYDLEKARQFGDAIEKIASEIVLQVGKRTYQSVIGNMRNPDDYPEGSVLHKTFGRKKGAVNPLGIGEHYHINVEKGFNDQDVYYVHYFVSPPKEAPRAERLLAQRKADEYLNQKYQELGPDAGISRE